MHAKGLRAFLIAGAILLSTSASYGSSVSLRYDGFNGTGVGVTGTTNTTSGLFHWTEMAGDPNNIISPEIFHNFVPNSLVQTFCIEIGQQIVGGNTYTFDFETNLAGLPQTSYGLGMGAARANWLQRLAELIGTNVLDVTNLNAAEFQAAIWNIVFDNVGDVDIASGAFALAGVSAANVNAILSAVAAFNTYDANTAQWFFIGLTNDNVQDHVTLVTREDFLIEAPVPAGAFLAGLGMICLGGVNYIRRRKMMAAA